MAGLVTMEDILEEIVGEIQDEYDQESPDILEMEDGTYRVQGTTSLEDLSEALDYPFESEDAESLAGLVLLLAGGFPPGQRYVRVRGLEDSGGRPRGSPHQGARPRTQKSREGLLRRAYGKDDR